MASTDGRSNHRRMPPTTNLGRIEAALDYLGL